jgi:hypothetical protein
MQEHRPEEHSRGDADERMQPALGPAAMEGQQRAAEADREQGRRGLERSERQVVDPGRACPRTPSRSDGSAAPLYKDVAAVHRALPAALGSGAIDANVRDRFA